ncbi:hypothetical protein [Globicatella sp. PHS-GS-PNBC-21-1553]|uniref:hypothetical protein n=1 Tax=Globicatella sp. PHS-GS-PNBC-21-1553 TaxID=2885764 RepID=UPI00298F09E8|nr:hypothetical protein [Globicatella sp. PHS-GS-PNBC-21-1553]WPC08722.1 hypothetical protein LB888_00215 [Globicatella sp. PHS-GS-PNBC-21-1553]
MMQDNKNTNAKLDQAFSKQIDEIDKRLDRGGMISLMIIVIGFLIIGYWMIEILSLNDEQTTFNDEATMELVERVEMLESRVAELEAAE